MPLQGLGADLGLAGVIMWVVGKDIIAPLIRRVPIFGNGKAAAERELKKKVEKLDDEVHNPEMIPGKSDTCQEHDRTITKIGTCLDENVKRLDRMEGKIDTAITLIRNGGKD
jgi:hypothetical protein